MRTSDVARLFDAPGPFLSIYLATEGDVENAAFRIAARWRILRGRLLDAGVPEAILEAVDPLVEGSHTAGATLAVIAAADGVVYAGSLPHPPPQDWVVRQGTLPYVIPLLVRDDPGDDRSAWFGEEPGQVALDREALVVESEPTPVEGRLVDVAVRAALGTGAEVRVLDPETDGRGPDGGVGAVLRYAT